MPNSQWILNYKQGITSNTSVMSKEIREWIQVLLHRPSAQAWDKDGGANAQSPFLQLLQGLGSRVLCFLNNRPGEGREKG